MAIRFLGLGKGLVFFTAETLWRQDRREILKIYFLRVLRVFCVSAVNDFTKVLNYSFINLFKISFAASVITVPGPKINAAPDL